MSRVESKTPESRRGLSGSLVEDLAQPGHQGTGGQAVGTQRTDQVSISQQRTVTEIDTIAAEKIEIFRRPGIGRDARDVGGDAMGGGELLTQCGQAVIAWTEVEAFPGDELAADLEIELPTQAVIGEDLAASHAAGGDPLEEEKARAFLQFDERPLMVTRAGLGNEGLRDPFEEGVALDPQVLVTHRRCLAAGAINPGSPGRAEDHPAARAGGDIKVEPVPIEKAGGRVDELDQQRAGLDVGLAEMNRRAEGLTEKIGRAVGANIAAKVEVAVDGAAGDAWRIGKSLHDRVVYWTADFSPLERFEGISSGLKSAVQ